MKYESPTSSGSEAIAKVKVFFKRNTHVKYESSTYSSS